MSFDSFLTGAVRDSLSGYTRPGRAELIEGVRLNIVDLANMLRLSAERPQSILYDPIRLLGDIKDQCERGIKLLEEL